MKAEQKYCYIFFTSICAAGYLWVLINILGLRNFFRLPGSVCVFKNMTGYPCPSCGSTRSVLAILHGNFVEAVQWNVLGYILVLILIIIPIWLFHDFIQRKPTFFVFYQYLETKLKQKAVYLILGAIVLGNWAWNIQKGL